jgi:oxygen-independent coproporphyrinogen-3 oxidase
LEIRKDYLAGETIETIYWGGGTPSLLQPNDFDLVFNAINQYYPISPNPEITLEANPDDMDGTYIAGIKRLPFNRISMGIQSFHDPDLRFLNRRHTAQQAINAVSRCRNAGYTNLSIDLMYGLPGQTQTLWEANIDEALKLKIPHLSAYILMCEEGTVMYQQLLSGAFEPLGDESVILLYDRLVEKLESAGYVHYEISNFCKTDCYSRHNTAYWTGRKYSGIGPAAHSYNWIERQWNIASLPDYMEGISKRTPYVEKETIDRKTRYNEYLMTRLRTMWGIRLSDFQDTFGQEWLTRLLNRSGPYLRSGLMERNEETLKVSRKGIMVTDGIIRELMVSD